jgi:hypothetical protein
LFGCAFKPSNKPEGSNFQTSPKGSNQAALLLKQNPKGSNHQRKIAQIGRFFSFFLRICKKSCIFAPAKIIDNKIIILMMKKFLFLPLLLIAMAVMVSAETPSLVPAMIVYGTDGSRQVLELDATNVTDLIVLQHGQSLSVDIPEAHINGIRSIAFAMIEASKVPTDIERAEDTLVRSVEKLIRDGQVILRLHTQNGGVIEYDIRGNQVISNK